MDRAPHHRLGASGFAGRVIDAAAADAPATGTGWQAELQIDYRRDGSRTLAQHRHSGPLRVLKALYPPGDPALHHVLVHPPGGIVGGDELRLSLQLGEGSHALLTTPGATRFYRSNGPKARQSVKAVVQAGARLEWLPLETIAYPGCQALNRADFELQPGAQMIGRELIALGLPDSGQPFDRGRFEQRTTIPGLWLERGCIDAADRALLQSPLGLAGQPVLGLLWWAAADAQADDRLQALAEQARERIAGAGPALVRSGCTVLHQRLVVLRLLAGAVEPAMALLDAVWGAWRRLAWDLEPVAPRVWRT